MSRVAHYAHPILPPLTSHQMQCEPVDVNSNVVTKAIISLDEAGFVVPKGHLLLRFSRFTIWQNFSLRKEILESNIIRKYLRIKDIRKFINSEWIWENLIEDKNSINLNSICLKQ